MPDHYRRLLNERGFFKRLYSDLGPVYCEALAPDVLPRVAIAVRAGAEVLGSIWAYRYYRPLYFATVEPFLAGTATSVTWSPGFREFLFQPA